MVFQSYALFPNMTVEGNVAFGLKMQKLAAGQIGQRVQEVLALVELSDLAKRYPHQLSGGQCQRVALARSLVTRPRLLLLDEPLSALDARIRKHLREQIRRIQRELNLTAIFVTHDQEEALTLSDRIVLMNKGQIVQSGDAETLYTQPADAFAAGFIGNYNLLTAEQAAQLTGRSYAGKVAIRPESIGLLPAGQGIGGVILGHSLLGNVVRYRIQVRGVELLVDVLNRSVADLRPDGAEVGYTWNLLYCGKLHDFAARRRGLSAAALTLLFCGLPPARCPARPTPGRRDRALYPSSFGLPAAAKANRTVPSVRTA